MKIIKLTTLVLIVGLTCAATAVHAFELSALSRKSSETGEIVTVTVQFAPPFGSGTTIEVIFLQRVGGVLTEVDRRAALGFTPNVSVDAEVPVLPTGDYEITVELDSIVNDPTDPPFRKGLPFLITPPRPFNLIVSGTALPAWNAAGGAAKNVEFGDLENDGDLDIYSFNSLNGDFIDRLAINQGGAQGGIFGEYSLSSGLPPIPAGTAGDDFKAQFRRTYDGDLVDVDGDGFRDVLRTDRNGLHIFLNQRDGTFVNRPDLLPTNDEILNGTGISGFNGVGGVIDFDGVDTADIDNDGDLDAIVANYLNEAGDGTRGESVLLINKINEATGKFVIANRDGDVWDDISDDMTHGVVFGDADGDGDPDVFLTNVASGQNNRLLINSGLFTGSFVDETDTRLPLGSVTDRESVDGIFRDFDGDGDQDLYVVDRNSANNLFWNNGSGIFTDLGAPNLPTQPGSGDSTYGLTAVDIDFDGDLDLIEAPGEGGSITEESRILINRGGNDGNLRFTARTDAYLPAPSHRLTIDTGDIDFDLDLDLIAGGFNSNELVLYENDLFDSMAEDADIVIMIDHTGSMITASHNYLEPVKNIAKAILARKRPDDRIGIVLFNYRGSETDQAAADASSEDFLKAETLVTLEQSESMTSVELDAIISAIDEGPCPPGRCTAIGQGLRHGLAEIKPNLNPERVKMLVLLTDGAQNMLPTPETVVGELVGGFPGNVRVYAIALGTDTDNQALTDLASLGSGFHLDVDALNLADIFENIESDATEKQILTSQPTVVGGKPVERDKFVDSGEFHNVRRIDFDDLKPGTVVHEQYAKLGVRIGRGSVWTTSRIVLDPFDDPDSESDRALQSVLDRKAIQKKLGGELGLKQIKTLVSPLTFRFIDLQKRIGLTAKLEQGGRTTATLSLFDPNGILLGSVQKDIAMGKEAFLGFESAAGSIARAQLQYSGADHAELIDDLLFEPASESNAGLGRTFFVGAEDKQIRVSLTWQKASVNPKLTLIKPSGGVISAASPRVREASGSVFHMYEIKAPEVGRWTAKITGGGAVLSVLSSSGLKLGLSPDRHRWSPNEPMTLTASLGSIVSGILKPVANAEFVVTVERPDGLLSSNGVSINPQPNGLYRITLADTALAGTYSVRVKALIDAGTEHEQSRSRRASLVSARQLPDDVCNKRSKIDAKPGRVAADGAAHVAITATLVDCNGRPWRGTEKDAGVKVTFWANGGRLIGTVQSNKPGIYTQTLVAPGSPTVINIHPVVGVRKLDIYTTVKVVVGPVDPKRTRLDLASSPGFIHADGHMEGAVLVTPVDVSGNRLGEGHDVKCKWIGRELSTWLGSVESDVDGVYARPFVSRKESGSSAAYCTVDGVVIDDVLIVNFFKPNDEVSDLDGDDIVSWNDNCPFEYNPDQADADGDRIGDVCEVEVPSLEPGEDPGDGNDYLLWWFLLLLLICFIAIFVYSRKR
ncbi:MAG: VCBS repeat-containing protein [Deltaproteobacteria bacterium]|nr:VCBS repeat-containing protein [Deltaproteobacteria bacterium]